MLSNAIKIGDLLISESRIKNGYLTWKGYYQNMVGDPKFLMDSYDLYSGNAGRAFFIYKLYLSTKDKKYLNTLEKIQNWNSEEFKSNKKVPGLYNGIYGIAYVDLLINRSNSDFLDLIKSTKIQDVNSFDIISGHSGCIIGLLMILKESEVNSEIDQFLIGRIGEHLSEMFKYIGIYKGSFVFKRANDEVLTGFSHGQAGTGYVLSLLSEFFDLEYLESFSNYLHSFEDQYFDSEIGNFIDLRCTLKLTDEFFDLDLNSLIKLKNSNDKPNMLAWCHGLPGVASAYQKSFKNYKYQDKRLKRNYHYMVSNFEKLFKNRRNCLCHGGPGNLDFFLDSTNYKETFDIDSIIKTYISQNILKDSRDQDDSLMNGIAGLGYFYLRSFNPKINGSILAPISIDDIKSIKKKRENLINYAKETLFNGYDYNDIQLYLLSLIKSGLKKKTSFSLKEKELKWCKEIDEFKSYFDSDYRALHDNFMRKFGKDKNTPKPLRAFNYKFEWQNNHIFSLYSKKIFLYLDGCFHLREISSEEIHFLQKMKKSTDPHKIINSFFENISDAEEYFFHLERLGLLKIKL